MNFLAEVLSSAEKIEVDEINQKVPSLKQYVEKLKSEVIQYTDNVYIKYSGRPKENRELLGSAQSLEEEINTLLKHAENATKKQLIKSSKQLAEDVNTLNSINFSLHVVLKLCQVNEKMLEFTTSLVCKEYLKCKKIISGLETTLSEISEDEKVIVIEELRRNIAENRIKLTNEVQNVFREKIVTNKGENMASIKIMSNTNPLEQALLAMFYNESFIFSLSSFSRFLWDTFFVPIVDMVVVVKIKHNDQFSEIQVDIVDCNRKSIYNEVFSNLKIVLEFLNTYFNFPLTTLSSTITTLEYIGLDIRDNLSELLIKHCLEDTVPSTIEGLKNYKIVIEETEKLEKALHDCKIFSHNTASLIDYANNIDILFINKKCKEYAVQSEQIMKRDLHDMVEVGVPYNPDNPLGCETNQFPQCSVSQHIIELLNYCEKILQQAVKSTDVNAGRILVTLQNIFRNYSKFVPEYHSKLLKTIPQQVALFHNNCFFVSHKLTDWNGQYILKLPSTLNLSTIAFELEICQLRQVGSEIFTTYVKGQIKQINEIMKDSGLEGTTLVKELEPVTEKCVRQCLRQQELLKTVWHKVLSYPIYNKTMGTILNSLCSSLITPIINFEDISSNSAEQLVEIIKIVLSRGPKLFTDSREVSLYVLLWYKLNELNFLLNASLMDINDRWADGKGPLALQFKPTELKTIIRALFQNTDMRASILTKIQE